MRISRIDLEGGLELHFAVLRRRKESPYINVEVITAKLLDKRRVLANEEKAVYEMAKYLQQTLDGVAGTRGDIEPYRLALEHFAD